MFGPRILASKFLLQGHLLKPKSSNRCAQSSECRHRFIQALYKYAVRIDLLNVIRIQRPLFEAKATGATRVAQLGCANEPLWLTYIRFGFQSLLLTTVTN